MADWPDGMKVGPIREWPGELTKPNDRQYPRFKAGMAQTLELLGREIWNLCDTRAQRDSAELLIAIPAGDQWRQDGRPRVQAKADHPGVIFSLDSKHGALSYPCDTFTTWQANLRAIALALEALRLVDRYGVTRHGEQYRGFLAIESTAMPAGFATAEDALEFLASIVRDEWMGGLVDVSYDNARALLRGAQRRTHPDADGSVAGLFQRVSLAETTLRREGVL